MRQLYVCVPPHDMWCEQTCLHQSLCRHIWAKMTLLRIHVEQYNFDTFRRSVIMRLA